jgi:hypothetical protein
LNISIMNGMNSSIAVAMGKVNWMQLTFDWVRAYNFVRFGLGSDSLLIGGPYLMACFTKRLDHGQTTATTTGTVVAATNCESNIEPPFFQTLDSRLDS